MLFKIFQKCQIYDNHKQKWNLVILLIKQSKIPVNIKHESCRCSSSMHMKIGNSGPQVNIL